MMGKIGKQPGMDCVMTNGELKRNGIGGAVETTSDGRFLHSRAIEALRY
jgi:hypothetical protein